MTSAGTIPNVETFNGTGRKECDTFIRSIRAAAWKEDKLDDDRWIAYFATPYFSGDALSWHSQLPPDIRRDWSKLEKALLGRWPSPEDGDEDESPEASSMPTPAAAPNSLSKNANQEPRHCVVKIFSAVSNSLYYLGTPDAEGQCGLTEDIGSALHLSVDVKANRHVLEVTPAKGRPRHMYFWLGIHWHGNEPLIKTGSDHWARIVLVDSITMKSSFSAGYPSFRITTWDISADDEIRPVWFQGNHKTLLETFIDESDLGIAVAADASTYVTLCPDEARARLFLQTLV